MKKWFQTATLGALLATGLYASTSASAATLSVTCVGNQSTTYSLGSASAAECGAGNDKGASGITATDTVLGFTGWILSDSSDDNAGSHVINFIGTNNSNGFQGPDPGAQSGTWSLDSFRGYPNVMITLKAGNTFAAFLIAQLDGLTGIWSTNRDLSHASVWYRGTSSGGGPNPVPLPGGIVLLLSGLVGLAGLGRMRKMVSKH